MNNHHRRCVKCGKTRAEDMTVSYHRFPNPGISNKTKARAWAKYCYPNEDWTSLEFLQSLYNKNKVLCGRHFHSSKFYDNMRQKLSIFAVPDSDEVQELLDERENIFTQSDEQAAEAAVAGPSIEKKITKHAIATNQQAIAVKNVSNLSSLQQPLKSVENLTHQQPTDSIQPSATNQAFVEKSDEQAAEAAVAGPSIEKKITKHAIATNQQAIAVKNVSNLSSLQQPLKSVENLTHQQPTDSIQPSATNQAFVEKNAVIRTRKQKHGVLKLLNISKKKELTPRELKMYNICKKKIRHINRLKTILKGKKTNFIEKICQDQNVQDLYNLKMTNSFITLLQSQLQNCPKKPKGRRYSIDQKLMALVIYKKSPACYRLLRRMFALPTQGCLNQLLNRVPLKPGINMHIFQSIKEMAENHTDEENICLLLFDEMSIRKHLCYDSKQDVIHGYQDHGSHGRSQDVASKALVFMLAGLRKKWKQPIAFYFTHSLTADRLTVILKEILTECVNAKVDVVGTICDLSTVNIKTLKTLGATTREPYFKYMDREYVAILDPPHLLKCTRNLLLKHDVECTADFQSDNIAIKGTAKWSHIEAFYNLDKNNPHFVFAPALTDQHIHPNVKQQMRVKLAAQIFSHSVAAGILSKIASNDLPTEAHVTASFIKKFDDLFDAVNADSPDLRRGKKYSTNMTAHSPHIGLFNIMRSFIASMKYLGARGKPPSQDGWVHTLNAIERLWKNLRNKNIKTISTRRLNQDALENCFGCIRYSCGSNANPTIQQFVAGIKTAIITNLRHSGQKKNCEEDNSILNNNLKSFLLNTFEEKRQSKDTVDFSVDKLDKLLSDAADTVEEATPESQACAYVSGFIFKKLRHNECHNCRKAFLSDEQEAIHIFTSLREYNENSALQYVCKNVVRSVEQCANIINEYLNEHGWEENLKNNIMILFNSVNFDFLNECKTHLTENMEHIKISSFAICIKRYIILKNRAMEDDEKNKALERKMKILKNK